MYEEQQKDGKVPTSEGIIANLDQQPVASEREQEVAAAVATPTIKFKSTVD